MSNQFSERLYHIEEPNRQFRSVTWLPLELAPRGGTVIFAIDSSQLCHLAWGDHRGFFDINTDENLTELRGWRSYRS
jgi:hypothetical protein